jgi:hypothetical protein
MEENKKPLNIEQAHNYLAEKEKTVAEDIKKEASKAQITVTPKPDRIKYLLYALSFLKSVSPEVERAFFRITGFISASMSNSEIARLLKRILTLRVAGCSIKRISYHLKEEPRKIEFMEQLALIAVNETIEKLKLEGIPILGGNN